VNEQLILRASDVEKKLKTKSFMVIWVEEAKFQGNATFAPRADQNAHPVT
jgi:hypothetical protein